ncbi:MAG TPA: ABC transporter permease [Polyangiaceae bacterium]|nr:ABC transporter permease [Polyangiaceae bacterium]
MTSGALVRSLRRTLAMTAKEADHIRRDPLTLFLALVLPVGLLLLFGYGVTFDLERLPIAVIDQDRTPESRSVTESFAHSRELWVSARPEAMADAEREVRRGRAVAVVLIPRGFARALGRGEAGELQLVVDGVDAATAVQTINKADAIASLALRAGEAAIAPRLVAQTWTLYNPAGRSALFIVPGLMAYVLAMVCVLLTALTVAREWERGSMEQLFTTPVRRDEIVVGKLVPYVGVGAIGVLLVLALGAWVFDVPIRGSLPALAVASLLFLCGMLGQGLLVSVLTKNQMVATQVGLLTSMLPVVLLSGFIFPIANMPRVLQAIAVVMPATHYIAALRGVLLRGAGFAAHWPNLLALAAFAAAMVALSTAKFRRRID